MLDNEIATRGYNRSGCDRRGKNKIFLKKALDISLILGYTMGTLKNGGIKK
jgi:hypothetical protein|nr:MAG TPA: hypothetical protein [Caudoviricetes sp.]